MSEQRPEQEAQQQESQWGQQVQQRLHAYYGPNLKEQLLASSAWHDLQRKLGPQQQPHKHTSWKHLFRRRGREAVPEYVRTAFMLVAYAAGIPHPLPALQCSFKKGAEPSIYTALGVKSRLCLILPPSAMMSIDGAILDTLLATGLARYRLTLRGPALLLHMLCFSPALLSLLLLTFSKGRYLVLVLVLVVLLLLLSWLLLKRLRRNICLSGDAMAVRWFGRERICQGLHGLADYQRMPFKPSKRNKLGKWSMPSLAERIERVCGAGIALEDERLTLVR